MWKDKDVAKRKQREYRQRIRLQVISAYGGMCVCCGERNTEFLAVDHVNGGGTKDRQTCSPQRLKIKIIKEGYPKDYRILCHNCNQSLGLYGYCPHGEVKNKLPEIVPDEFTRIFGKNFSALPSGGASFGDRASDERPAIESGVAVESRPGRGEED